MTYGVCPEGMPLDEFTLECQARMVVREMRGKPREQRRGIFERWAKLPSVTQDRVQRIWKDGSEK